MMSPSTLIQSRHSLWMSRLRELNQKANDGEQLPGPVSIEEAEAEAVAIIGELEHIADAMGISLDERLR